jgi:hypothetical protein
MCKRGMGDGQRSRNFRPPPIAGLIGDATGVEARRYGARWEGEDLGSPQRKESKELNDHPRTQSRQ